MPSEVQNVQNTLQPLCTSRNIVRETYYGTTHRAAFSISGENKQWDILHISIPFSPQKEAEFMRRFNVSREDLGNFYHEFSKNILNHVRMAKETVGKEDSPEALKKSIISYKAIQSFKKFDADGKPSGTDLYLVTEPMDSFVGSPTFKSDGTDLKTLNSLGLRLLQTAKSMNDRGFTMGAIDLDSFCLDTDINDRRLLKTGYLFFGTSPDGKPSSYTQDATQSVKREVASGEVGQSLDTDVYMICQLLWGLYDGQHYTNPVDLRYEPKFASDEIKAALKAGLENGAAAFKLVGNTLRASNKKIDAGELPNILIPFATPAYMFLPLPEPRAEAEEKTAEEPEKQAEEEQNKKKKPRKGGIIFILLAVAMLAFALLGPARPLVMNLLGRGQEPVVADPDMSETQGLYVLNGSVVNADGTPNELYVLNENGDIILPAEDEESEPTVLFDAEHCSAYVVAEKAKISILEKSFSVESLDCLVWKDNVADLREEEFFIDPEADEQMIPLELVEKYELSEESTVIVSRQDVL